MILRGDDMAKEKNKNLSVKEGHIVVKNKKFKISDIIMFLVCLIISFVIWMYASNAEQKNQPPHDDEPQDGVKTVQEV